MARASIKLFLKVAVATVLLALSGFSIVGLKRYQRYQANRTRRFEACQSVPPLTSVRPDDYDIDGIKQRQGTFLRQVSVEGEAFPVIVFPAALFDKRWYRLSTDHIHYLGKGGEAGWRDRISPDRYYLVDIPENATALAFSRLCYRNGDVGVLENKSLELVESGFLSIINSKLTSGRVGRTLLINDYLSVQPSEVFSLSQASAFLLTVVLRTTIVDKERL